MKSDTPKTLPSHSDGITLVVPRPDFLPAYEAALEKGWSSDTMRDVSGEQLAALRADPEEFLHRLLDQSGTVTLHDGRVVPRLPFRLFWLWDGDFCGSIMLRFQPGTEELPPHCIGHIGYSVVPWKQRRGYATAALRLILPVARDEGLRSVEISCRETNIASRKVIEANGGVLEATMPAEDAPGEVRLVYRVRVFENA
ncbi:GNAT family N-acetyltransferase [Microvirga solisilvae]|uniref:GNAT family N-acetyltransferase n=1 Tax=Microvirga solisilvae TaxID=2919498 RepID=UPI001FAFA4B5|nr:GNAT family N-acetyltransferase [Microvirga solisilvae]